MPLRELTASTATPVATIATNLMPAEVIARRRLGWLKRRLGFALLAVLALVVLGYAITSQLTTTAQDDLATAQAQTSSLQRQVTGFADVTNVQNQISQIKLQLSGVMASDLPWTTLVNNIEKVAPKGLTVAAVAAQLDVDPAGGGQAPAPAPAPAAGTPTVGSIDVSGTARDYRSVAAFADALARVRGFVDVDPGSLSGDGRGASYTLTLSFTKAVFGGRFSTPGGK